jgi:hypothetical protein
VPFCEERYFREEVGMGHVDRISACENFEFGRMILVIYSQLVFGHDLLYFHQLLTFSDCSTIAVFCDLWRNALSPASACTPWSVRI